MKTFSTCPVQSKRHFPHEDVEHGNVASTKEELNFHFTCNSFNWKCYCLHLAPGSHMTTLQIFMSAYPVVEFL